MEAGEGITIEPIIRDWLIVEPELRLVGSKCRRCGKLFFPPTETCAECFSQDIERVPLSKEGEIHSFSIIRVPPDPSFKVPYVLAYIDLPEDVRVFTQLEVEEKDYDKLRIGMKARIMLGVVRYENKGGKEIPIYGYKFKPIFEGSE